MTFGSLFDGVGCYSLGLLRAGMRCLWTVEIDPRCREVTALRFPGVAQHEDVREVGANNLEPVDVLVGASPCQDLSVAGKGRGLAGERSGLLREMARVASQLITLCCSVVRAMTGLSRLTIPLVSSSDIVLTISGDWFSGVKLSDSKKYHMIGNGGAPQVMEWVGRRIILAERDGHVGDPEKGQQG